MRVKEKSNTTGRCKTSFIHSEYIKVFTVNINRTTSSLLINGPQVQKFI